MPALALLFLGVGAAAAAEPGHPEESHNMRLLGHVDLQGRTAYQPIIRRQGDRYIAYVGHHDGEAMNPFTGKEETNGHSVVDVTDPRNPVQLAHVPGASGAQMLQVCDGDELPNGDPSKTYLLRTNGDDGHEIWDVTDPARSQLLTKVLTGLNGTHKNWWECDTGIAYLVADLRPDGWSIDRGLKIFDLGDPAEPVFIRNFGLTGDAPGQGGSRTTGGLHEPTVYGDRVYLAYGVDAEGVIQILDRERLLEGNPNAPAPFAPTPENLAYPIVGQINMPAHWGGHTAFPVMDVTVPGLDDFEINTLDLLVVASEATANECEEAIHHMTWLLDITDESHPYPISNFHVPEDSGNFCERGGRFGAHAPNWSYNPMYYRKVVFFSYFNAGARAVDIRDPFNPREIGYFIPATTEMTDERCVEVNGEERCKFAIQTNNVELDDRGYLYLADRANTGLHIVELTGPLAEIASLPVEPLPARPGAMRASAAHDHAQP